MATAYGYGRQSDPDATGDDSPEIQKQAIERYYDYALKPEQYAWGGFVADLGISGSKPFANRPQGCILGRKLEKGDVVIFAKLDRGFRDTRDTLDTVKAWEARGVRAMFLDLNVDTGTAIGMFILTTAAAIATMERERAGERMREFQRKRKAEGRPHTRPPYGYKNVGAKGKREFAEDPEQRKVGKLILQWRLQNYPWEAIYWALIRRGAKQRNGNEYSRSTIQNYAAGELRLMGLEIQKAKGRKSQTEIDGA